MKNKGLRQNLEKIALEEYKKTPVGSFEDFFTKFKTERKKIQKSEARKRYKQKEKKTIKLLKSSIRPLNKEENSKLEHARIKKNQYKKKNRLNKAKIRSDRLEKLRQEHLNAVSHISSRKKSSRKNAQLDKSDHLFRDPETIMREIESLTIPKKNRRQKNTRRQITLRERAETKDCFQQITGCRYTPQQYKRLWLSQADLTEYEMRAMRLISEIRFNISVNPDETRSVMDILFAFGYVTKRIPENELKTPSRTGGYFDADFFLTELIRIKNYGHDTEVIRGEDYNRRFREEHYWGSNISYD